MKVCMSPTAYSTSARRRASSSSLITSSKSSTDLHRQHLADDGNLGELPREYGASLLSLAAETLQGMPLHLQEYLISMGTHHGSATGTLLASAVRHKRQHALAHLVAGQAGHINFLRPPHPGWPVVPRNDLVVGYAAVPKGKLLLQPPEERDPVARQRSAAEGESLVYAFQIGIGCFLLEQAVLL